MEKDTDVFASLIPLKQGNTDDLPVSDIHPFAVER